MPSYKRRSSERIIVKSTGGAAAQVLTLLSAIYVSKTLKKPFLLRHYPYGTGGYYPFAISSLLNSLELENEYQLTKGFDDSSKISVGAIAENHPIFKSGMNREKIFEFLRKIQIDSFLLRIRGEWAIKYSANRLNNIPQNSKMISGGYFPFRDSESIRDLASRFKKSGFPNIFYPEPDLGFEVGAVIHYRLGNKRTAFSHPELGGAVNGIIDPLIFKEILNTNNVKGEIYVVSDEPELAKQLLNEVGIKAIFNPLGKNLWFDLKLMANSKLLICPWSTVSQLAISCIQNENIEIYYPDQTGDGSRAKWKVENVIFYTPKYLPPSHRIFNEAFVSLDSNHEVYKENNSEDGINES